MKNESEKKFIREPRLKSRYSSNNIMEHIQQTTNRN